MAITVALVAGENSGDQLGSALIEQLRSLVPGCQFVGVGGERMRAAGMECWWSSDDLAVFGLFEVLSHLRRIWKIRKSLIRRLARDRPQLFIGIDAPDFNLGLEKSLRSLGIHTVHYVSPTVWAWRRWRVRKVREAANLVLCLFPFEPDFYFEHGVNAVYVGHPMADEIDPQPSTSTARRALGITDEGPVIALLPGSRLAEVGRLANPMLGAALLLSKRFRNAHFVAALASDRVADSFRASMNAFPDAKVTAFRGKVREVISASDVVLCASGTVTLETMLINRPMVTAYRLSPATYHLARATKLVKARYVSLPNILANRQLVPELIQDDASAENLAREATAWLEDPQRLEAVTTEFDRIHKELACNASRTAAREIQSLLEAQ